MSTGGDRHGPAPLSQASFYLVENAIVFGINNIEERQVAACSLQPD